MLKHANDEKRIFLAALEASSARREEYLQEACAGDSELLERVRELLSAHQEAQGPLDALPPGCTGTRDLASAATLGALIGPYKLMEQIGEGGMGLVFVADQQRPVKRRVALKLIKPGM